MYISDSRVLLYRGSRWSHNSCTRLCFCACHFWTSTRRVIVQSFQKSNTAFMIRWKSVETFKVFETYGNVGHYSRSGLEDALHALKVIYTDMDELFLPVNFGIVQFGKLYRNVHALLQMEMQHGHWPELVNGVQSLLYASSMSREESEIREFDAMINGIEDQVLHMSSRNNMVNHVSTSCF